MIQRLPDESFGDRLEEAERFHMGVGKVLTTVRQLTTDLNSAKIDYAIAGAMALNAHGYRRETVEVNVLIRPEGLERFRDELVGRGYRPAFEGARKAFRNVETDVPVDFITTGEYPGDGKPKPVAFPDPAAVSVVMDGIRVLDLPTLVELKLASGMTQPSRLRDLADVQDLIRLLKLDDSFADKLAEFVRDRFLVLLRETKESGTTPDESGLSQSEG